LAGRREIAVWSAWRISHARCALQGGAGNDRREARKLANGRRAHHEINGARMNQAEADTATAPGRLRLGECCRFFLPLVLMVELNMISKSVIHAFLARTETPSTTLAAFNAGFTFYFAITSATEVTTLLCLSYLKSRRDVFRLLAFMALVLVLPLTVVMVITFTDLGEQMFGNWFGLSEQGRREACQAAGFLAISAPFLLFRGVAFALLMMDRRTIIITWSTLVRLASLSVSLLILPMWLDGAAIGAAALVVCMASEAMFAWLFAWRSFMRLPAVREARDTLLGYWRFAWPLIINGSAEMGVILVINLFLGRLSEAELAIAAFGVVHGLVSLLMAPMRNLTQSAQTLVKRPEDVRQMIVFSAQLVAIFAIAALVLFETPLRSWILKGVMGLTPELAAYSTPALTIAFVMAPFWACAALFRGLLARSRTTLSLALSGALRIISAGAAASVSYAYPELNGALMGIGAWILSYAIETAISSWRLTRLGWYVETG
jgi:Na+-driven multidrug efflux pump